MGQRLLDRFIRDDDSTSAVPRLEDRPTHDQLLQTAEQPDEANPRWVEYLRQRPWCQEYLESFRAFQDLVKKGGHSK